MKYKPGDRVRVVGAQRGIHGMQKMIGRVCTVYECYDNSCSLVEALGYHWIEKWLKPYVEDVELDISTDEIMNCFGD